MMLENRTEPHCDNAFQNITYFVEDMTCPVGKLRKQQTSE